MTAAGVDTVAIGIDIGGTAVKLAAVGGGGVLWTAKSPSYHRPGAQDLAAAIRHAAAGRVGGPAPVGLCVPGILDDTRAAVLQSVNVPCLNGLQLDRLIADGFGAAPRRMIVATDAQATACDIQTARRLSGRLFLLAIGTGVGAAVLDDGIPLRVDGDSPGHFGQIDVSVEGNPVVGPDGGAGSLEGYLSGPALGSRFGDDPSAVLSQLDVADPSMRALARAVRIAHGLFRPHHVVLAGGIGIRLARLVPDLRAAVSHQLTKIARPGWTFSAGDSDFHAAQGAARLALISSSPARTPDG